jgi:hypothetical protein
LTTHPSPHSSAQRLQLERTPRASAGPGRRFDHQSALCTQGASSALRTLTAWTIWPIISFSLTLPLTLLVVAYYVSVTLVGLASLSPAAFLALLLVAYSVAATLTALIVGLVLFTSFITQIIGFVALAVVDSVTMLPIQPARHAGEPAATVRYRMVRRKTWRGKHAALGVDKAKRKRRLGLLRIRGRQIPQIRTTGRGENHVFAGDGGDSGESVNRRRRRIPGREAISRRRRAKRGEKESKRHHGSTQQPNTNTHVPTNSPQGIPHSGY